MMCTFVEAALLHLCIISLTLLPQSIPFLSQHQQSELSLSSTHGLTSQIDHFTFIIMRINILAVATIVQLTSLPIASANKCRKDLADYGCGAGYQEEGYFNIQHKPDYSNCKCCCEQEDGGGYHRDTCDWGNIKSLDKGCGSCMGKEACKKVSNSKIGDKSCVNDKSCRDMKDSFIKEYSCRSESACQQMERTHVGTDSCGIGKDYTDACFGMWDSTIGDNSCQKEESCNQSSDGISPAGYGSIYQPQQQGTVVGVGLSRRQLSAANGSAVEGSLVMGDMKDREEYGDHFLALEATGLPSDCTNDCGIAIALANSRECTQDVYDSALKVLLPKALFHSSDEEGSTDGWHEQFFDNVESANSPISLSEVLSTNAKATDSQLAPVVYLYDKERVPVACAYLEPLSDEEKKELSMTLNGEDEDAQVITGFRRLSVNHDQYGRYVKIGNNACNLKNVCYMCENYSVVPDDACNGDNPDTYPNTKGDTRCNYCSVSSTKIFWLSTFFSISTHLSLFFISSSSHSSNIYSPHTTALHRLHSILPQVQQVAAV